MPPEDIQNTGIGMPIHGALLHQDFMVVGENDTIREMPDKITFEYIGWAHFS